MAAVVGDRELLRPLSPRTPSRQGPMMLSHGKRATKDEIVNSLDDDEFELVMNRLSGGLPAPVGDDEITFTTRYTLSIQNTQAAQYILEYLEALGYDAFYHTFRYSSSNTQNIVAVKRGVTYPDEVVVYSAHMDSTSGQASTNAPGCIDNGSGTGCMRCDIARGVGGGRCAC